LDTADVVLVGDDLLDGLAQRWQMKDEAVASAFGLRPDEVVWLHVRRALWVAYLDRFARAPYTASQP
jgi:hypothetical protein